MSTQSSGPAGADKLPADVAATRRFAVLDFAQVCIAVAERDIQTLEPVLDVERQGGVGRAAGVLRAEGGTCPVHALTSDLDPLPDIPDDHHICVVLRHPAGNVGIACRDVRAVDAQQLVLSALPDCYAANATPLRALGILGHRVVAVASVRDLVARLALCDTLPDSVSEGASALDLLDPGAVAAG